MASATPASINSHNMLLTPRTLDRAYGTRALLARHLGRSAVAVLVVFLSGCVTPPRPAPPPAQPAPVAVERAPQPARPAAKTEKAELQPVSFADLPGWTDDRVSAGWQAFVRGCPALKAQPRWTSVCEASSAIAASDEVAVRSFLESRFVPHRVVAPGGAADGLLTGYYEPLLRGSRSRDDRYRHPLYAPPDDLITVDLAAVAPDTRNLRLKGRLDGRKLVPYWSRSDIDQGRAPLAGRELAWVDDALDLFFLQIQGSGRLRLPDGTLMRVGYADQNGHPYRSIGRLLVERGELSLDAASMQGIRDWARANPDKLPSLLAENPSYVFFRELPAGNDGPPGSLGIPLTAGRSLAVDPTAVPMGAPVFIDSVMPGSGEPLRRLLAAQDTGGAIKGSVRADFFWGFGDEAGALAGRMRQPLRMWVLLPAP